MKKFIFSIFLLLLCAASFACPICGCGVGGFYMGLMPHFKNRFIGIRYQYSHYNTRLADDPSEFSKDHYHTAEIWGGVSLGTRWQLLGFVPYHINEQYTDEGTKTKNGLGDITVLANYKIWSSARATKSNKTMKQEAWIGAGAKLPTGTYKVDLADPETELGDVNSQMGTGSTDFITNAMYNVSVGKWGVNTTANYKVNTANHSRFKYGNRFSANSFVYYQQRVNSVMLSPNAGVLFEDASVNHLDSKEVVETGGYVTLASAGLEANIGKLIIGSNVQLPFLQDYAHGQTVAKARCLVHLTIAL